MATAKKIYKDFDVNLTLTNEEGRLLYETLSYVKGGTKVQRAAMDRIKTALKPLFGESSKEQEPSNSECRNDWFNIY